MWDFEETEIGKVPDGWKVNATDPRGKLATWEVISDPGNGEKTRVFGVTKINDDFGGVFNICLVDGVQFKDGEIDVRFKAISGIEDQGGGVIWRVQDKDNYYVARANPLENNFRIYYVKEGARKMLDGKRIDVSANQWYTIKIIQNGEKIEGYLDGEKLLEYEDNTFPEAGGVGLWTKADAVTYFDDFTVTPSEKRKDDEI